MLNYLLYFLWRLFMTDSRGKAFAASLEQRETAGQEIESDNQEEEVEEEEDTMPASRGTAKTTGLPSVVIKADPEAPPPKRWVPVGKVDRLFIYPLKSAKGVEVKHAVADRHGLYSPSLSIRDRQLLVVDRKGKFVTARRYPPMVLIEAQIRQAGRGAARNPRGGGIRALIGGFLGGGGGLSSTLPPGAKYLELQAPEMSVLEVPLPEKKKRWEERAEGDEVSNSAEHDADIVIWLDRCSGRDLGEEAGRWISKFILGREDGGFRIVFHVDNDSSRPTHDDQMRTDIIPFAREGDVPLYADGFGFLLFSRESVADVNAKLKERGVGDLQVEERRFRPNILVKDVSSAFAEDSWRHVRIGGEEEEEEDDEGGFSGGALFRNVKLCKRCSFTTIDPERGERHPRGEPLKTLRSYRCTLDTEERRRHFGGAPMFGVNLAVDRVGTVRVGDTVYAGVEGNEG